MSERTYRALLVANWQFPRDADHLPDLNGPRLDLPLLRDALTDQKTGLHRKGAVTVLANRTKAMILRRVEDFFRDASRHDQLLLYYSGHGRLNLEDQLYLCAKDTDTNRLVTSGIAARDISQMIENSPARAKVVLLDCCYSGSFKSGAAHPERLGGEGRFVLTSSRRAQLTGDATDPDEPSPFTSFLTEALRGGATDSDTDGYISIEDVYRHVRERMREKSGSTPQRSFDHAVGELAMARALGTRAPARRTTEDTPAARPARTRTPAPAKRAVLAPDAVRAAYESAQLLARRGDVRGARQGYQRVIDAGHGDWTVLAARALATLLARTDDVAAAAAAYRLVIADGHRDWAAQAACELGRLLGRHGKAAAARDAYENAVDADHPEWTPCAAVELATLLTEQGDLVGARSLYQQAMDSGHTEWAPRAAVRLGELLVTTGELGAARAVYHRALLSGHAESARCARKGLRRLRASGATSLADLVHTLATNDRVDARWLAAELLAEVTGDSGDTATSTLVTALADEEPIVRQACVRALGTRGSSTAVAPVITALTDDDVDVRWAAVDALAAIGEPAAPALVRILSTPAGPLAVAALAAMPHPAVPAIAAALRTKVPLARQRAADALARHGEAALPALFEAFRSTDPGVRRVAATALVDIGEPAVHGLLDDLSAKSPALRVATARVLGAIGSPQALPVLEKLLADPDATCRAAGADAIAGHGWRALPTVVRALHSTADPTRAAAIRAAVGLGGEILPDLQRLAGEATPAGRAAVTALQRIGTPAALFHLSERGLLSLVAVADPQAQ